MFILANGSQHQASSSDLYFSSYYEVIWPLHPALNELLLHEGTWYYLS
jgi:hypothetical protein